MPLSAKIAQSFFKKTFKSTRDDTKKGKLEYSTKTAAEVKAAKKRMSDRERARVGDKSKQLSEKGAAFKLARKMGKMSADCHFLFSTTMTHQANLSILLVITA